MHELGIAQAIVSLVEEEARKAAASRVAAITLSVGELSGIVAEQLDFCFPIAARGTLAEGAELRMDPVEGEAHCPACDRPFHMTHLLDPCPRCGGHTSDVRAGGELLVASLEVE